MPRTLTAAGGASACLQKQRQEEEARKSKGAAEKERLRLQLEDDRVQRAMQQVGGAERAVAAEGLVSSPERERGGGRHGEEGRGRRVGKPLPLLLLSAAACSAAAQELTAVHGTVKAQPLPSEAPER